MDLIMTMFKTKTSMSPVKVSPGAKKRPAPESGYSLTNSNSNSDNDLDYSQAKSIKLEEKKFTFNEVKAMLDKLTQDPEIGAKTSASAMAGLKHINFDEVAIPGHSVQGCKDLLERLVKSARRVRTLQEVLTDIRDNLEKRTYTEIIHRASLDDEAPKRPPSAYLIYHQERYNDLKKDFPLAAEVSKIVSLEWKNMSEKKRKEYHSRHAKLLKEYLANMQRLGLSQVVAPKRPKSARNLYIEHRMAEQKRNEPQLTADELGGFKEEFGREFDNLDRDDKEIWIQHHSEKQLEYKRERAEYVSAHPHLNHHTGSGARANNREKKASPPALPMSPWKFYLAKKMPQGVTAGPLYEAKKKALKEKFQSLSERKLLKFIKKAVRDKQRYDEEVEQFLQDNPDFKIPKSKPSIHRDHWKIYFQKVENKPSLPAPTAYLHYCSKLLSEMYTDTSDNQPPTQRMQLASRSWNSLSENEKNEAELEHIESVKTYCTDMEDWLSKQPASRVQQILSDEPKSDPAYWRKKLNRLLKKRVKQSNE